MTDGSSHSNAVSAQVFSAEECDRIIALAQKFEAAPAKVPGSNALQRFSRRHCTVSFLAKTDETAWVHDRLFEAVEAFNQSIWQFDVSTVETPQFVSYGWLNHFARHMDSGVPAFSKRKLTISVQLSPGSQYAGGNLHVWSRNKDGRKAPRERGQAIIFPAHLWHSVSPVLWGKRQSLISWISGENPLR